mmetsp:Transcript_70750/g.140361  ORF Transcript_70750/g.140361 Transcript_70750/m.140361 type:complete len:101 (-) Transcript_70750:850-1152(-)
MSHAPLPTKSRLRQMDVDVVVGKLMTLRLAKLAWMRKGQGQDRRARSPTTILPTTSHLLQMEVDVVVGELMTLRLAKLAWVRSGQSQDRWARSPTTNPNM